jgi:hypothetical protein
MYYKRTLILNDITAKTSSKKGVITLENNDNKIKGSLKLYNFDTLPPSVAIGISSGDDIIKVPISGGDSCLEFDVLQKVDLQDKISCALVDISEKTCPKIIIGGTSNYLNDWADKVEQAFTPSVLSREEMYAVAPEEIEQEITTVLQQDKEYKDCSMCQNCKYKQAFYEVENKKCETKPANIQKIEEILSSPNVSLATEEDNKKQEESNLDVDEKQNFYMQIKSQIDDLFKNHSRQQALESIIPNSQWVKVEYQDMPGHYVMGLIYDENKLQFISYGLPADNKDTPPKDLAEYAQWLELDADAEPKGYWLVYQNADNGESVKID